MILLFAALGNFIHIAGRALASIKEDSGYVVQSRYAAGELRALERAEPAFGIKTQEVEFFVGKQQHRPIVPELLGQFSFDGGLIYLHEDSEIIMIGLGRRRVDASCRYDIVGRRCI
ncbi:MAG: hypothetical protein JKX85_02660 [Phycisphaeraceae bacterium]|nr:hypothetical protein [Phycisphaeraceae bacterium]